MSTLRATNLKGGSAGSAPNFPDGAVITGVATVGVLSATTIYGSGANLTGIDATALKDGGGTVRVQANTDGAVVTGILTAPTVSGTTGSFTGNVSVGGTLTYEDVTNVDSVGLITARNGIKVTGGDVQVGAAVTVDTSGINVTGVVTATSFVGDGANLTNLPPAGNTVSLVADGAIAAGKAAIITTAGKAKQVGEDLQGLNSFDGTTGASELTLASPARDQFDLSWDSYRNKALFSYIESSNCKVDVLAYAESYSDNSASVAKTKTVKSSVSSSCNTSMAWDPDTNQTIIGYRDGNLLRISYASLDAGSEVTLGTAHAVSADNVYPETIRVVYDTLNNAVICIWQQGAGNTIWARAGTISGDNMTWGTAAQLSNINTLQGSLDACWDSTNNKVLVAFKNGQNSWYLSGAALSCSGTTLTWGSVVALQSYGASFINLAFDSDEGKALLTFKNDSNNNGYAQTFYISSGTTVTSGATANLPGASSGGTTWSGNSVKGHSSCYDTRGKRFIIVGCWTNSGLDQPFGNMIAISSAGAETLSWKGSTMVPFDNGFDTYDAWDSWACSSLSNWGKNIFVGRRTNGSSRIWLNKSCSSQTNLTNGHTNVVGFAEDAISDGATGTIKTYGNVVGNQSGLTAGSTYYVGSDGTLQSGGGQLYYGGLALSATTLLIQRKMN